MTIQTTQQIKDKYSVLNNTFRLSKLENPKDINIIIVKPIQQLKSMYDK